MEERYGYTPAVLHWVLALVVLVLYGLGWYMVTIPKGTPPVAYFYNLHKSIGIVAALPLVLLIGWRMTHIPPRFPNTLPQWEARAAHINHVLFYVCLVVLVASGFIESNFTRFGIKFFGYPLPVLGWEDRTIYRFFNRLHVYTSHFFVVLIAIHIGAAFKHLLVNRDQVFQRMLPAKSQF
ncbi:MAG TPA: cytochrome b [Burkholderiales bacterium]